MARTITWLHLSDLHARQRDDWDARFITDSLVRDLRLMQHEEGLRPDLIFFTGDIAYGAVNGERMEDQYAMVRAFLDAVRRAFEPEIAARDIYLVPGNHDVDRNEITPEQTAWLRDRNRTLPEIVAAMRDGKKQWRGWMERLTAYRNFVTAYGLLHLLPDDGHAIWADARDIAGVRVGIAGLNSAWSCAEDDKGRIWCGAEWQVSELVRRIGPVDFSLALIHHPGNWFTGLEDPAAMRYLRQAFPVVLHGHEHADWIEADADGRIVISAGACYQCSWMENGYSFGALDLELQTGRVWLRQWDRSGRGWVARNVASKTRNGVWSLGALPWLAAATSPAPATAAGRNDRVSTEQAPNHGVSVAGHYTQRYCKHVIDQHDVLELFGCDIPRELQRHQLSVAYISLNLAIKRASEDDDAGNDASPSSAREPQSHEVPLLRSAAIGEVLDSLPHSRARLLITGPAGAGKSTLLRWCAIHAAQSEVGRDGADLSRMDVIGSNAAHDRPSLAWRHKVPVLVRLRDCPSGRLPAAVELPGFVAKHLPSAPADWITAILAGGQALVLLDGVDEVHRDRRPQLAEEIGLLVRTYPACTYVVSTRPGAVEDGWLDWLQFTEAQVEPMSRGDRDEFIDRWYRSAALELKHRPRPGEDLAQTAVRLKMELVAQAELAALATNPLLCAMICALYRERRERLPETSAELCEALCHMLIHRRERETPGLEDAHFVAVWRELSYAQKKGLLSDLAWHMMQAGESSIEEGIALELMAAGLTATPGRTKREAADVLTALIERSGMLRPVGDDHVEFLHNTLKEYLAAGIVDDGVDWKVLADHADDAAWQPVILFALSRAGAPFNSGLVNELLERAHTARGGLTGKRNMTKAERAALTAVKQKEFFLVRCRAVAKRLATDVSAKIDRIARNFLPPATMLETEALAQVGPRILLYSSKNLSNPSWWRHQNAAVCVRSLRLLRRIGGPQARSIFLEIKKLPSGSPQLTAEWFMSCSEFSPMAEMEWPFDVESEIYLSSSAIRDLTPIRGMNKIEDLYIGGTKIDNLSPIRHMSTLLRLDVSDCPIKNLGPLSDLRSLKYLCLAGSTASSFEAIGALKDLEHIVLNRSKLADLHPIGALVALQRVYLRHTSVSDVSPLSALKSLRVIHLTNTLVTNITPLAELPSLEEINLDQTMVCDLTPISHLLQLRHLSLEDAILETISPLRGLTSLRRLNLNGVSINSLDDIGCLSALMRLELANVQVSSYEFLARLTALTYLDLRRTNVVDLSPLRTLGALKMLSISDTRIADLAPLADLPLKSLDLTRTPGCSLVPLVGIPSLRSIKLDANAFAEAEIREFARQRPEVHIVRSRVVDGVQEDEEWDLEMDLLASRDGSLLGHDRMI